MNAPNDCVFPFVYNGQAYHDCTEDDRAKAWCSLTYEYDKDLKWGHCNPCRGETLSIEQSLLEHCSLVREQMDGWVWDPFLEEVRSEYLNCEKVGTGLPVNIPISQSIVLDPKLHNCKSHHHPEVSDALCAEIIFPSASNHALLYGCVH